MGASGDCTSSATCPLPNGYLSSPPSLAGSAVFVVAFAVLIPINFVAGIRHNTPLYSSAIIAGLLFEVVGYIGRLMLHSNVASVSGFIVYMVGTIMGPAFVTSAIYQILPHVVVLYGKQFSLISQPAYFGLLFLALDMLTLVIQAAGIAVAVTGDSQAELARGINVLLAGLGMQLASSALFLCIYWYFVHRLHHRRYILDPTFQDVFLSPKFRSFLLCMQISILLILGRTAVRFASLLGDFSNPLNQSQPLTLALDGTLVFLAAAILTFVPAGSAFRTAWHETSPGLLPPFRRGRPSAGSGRRNGYYRRPANISLPVATRGGSGTGGSYHGSPASPPYYYSVTSSPGHPMSPSLPTPPLHTFTPRSPPYHVIGGRQQHGPVSPPYYSTAMQQQQQQQQQQQGRGPMPPPIKTSPGFVRPPPYGQGQGSVMSPGPGPVRQGFLAGHRRQQASASLVNSDALW